MNYLSSKKKLIFDINNKTTTDPNVIANGFNKFFVTIGPQLAKYIKSDINPLSYVKSSTIIISIKQYGDFLFRILSNKHENTLTLKLLLKFFRECNYWYNPYQLYKK